MGCQNYFLKVVSVGLITLVLLSVTFFGIRKITDNVAFTFVWPLFEHSKVKMPSRLTDDLDKQPETVEPSSLRVKFGAGNIYSTGFGIYKESKRIAPYFQTYTSDFQTTKNSGQLIYFDPQTGLFVYSNYKKTTINHKDTWNKDIIAYAGPKGVSETPSKSLGRFFSPIASIVKERYDLEPGLSADKNLPEKRRRRQKKWATRFKHDRFIVYDSNQNCFCKINFDTGEVIKGPKLSSTETIEPVQINWIGKEIMRLQWSPPMIEVEKEVDEVVFGGKGPGLPGTHESKRIRIRREHQIHPEAQAIRLTVPRDLFFLILDKTGNIFKLDLNTLVLTERLGHLPTSFGRYNPGVSDSINHLFGYQALAVIKQEQDQTQYKGLVTASVDRDTWRVAISVFDEKGIVRQNRIFYFIDTLENQPGGLLYMVTKYLVENLQPALFGLASYASENSFEATAGHRALFFLPNSFVAMFARDNDAPLLGRWIILLLMIRGVSI